MLRYKKRLFWIAAAIAVTAALWMLNVEITYQRNVRHIPTDFRLRHRVVTYTWKA